MFAPPARSRIGSFPNRYAAFPKPWRRFARPFKAGSYRRGMNRKHASVIALLLGLAALLGTFAVLRTTHLGAASRSANDARIAAEQRRLTAAERSLRHALASAPPPPATAKAPKTDYVRPAPIVVRLHRHGDDGEGESFDD
jgi:hypothetical protein